MNTRLSLALIISFICANIKETSSGGCFCYNGAGTYCGFQRENGYIAGDCTAQDTYICPADHGGLAHHNGRCFNDSCVGSVPAGRDFCDPERRVAKYGKLNNTSTGIMDSKEKFNYEIYIYATFGVLLILSSSLPVMIFIVMKCKKKKKKRVKSENIYMNEKLHDGLHVYDMPQEYKEIDSYS